MTDLAQLATEITPGTWEADCALHAGGEVFSTLVFASGRRVVSYDRWQNSLCNQEELIANATAMALVPELIADALQLREDMRILKGGVLAIGGEIDRMQEQPEDCENAKGRMALYWESVKRLVVE